MAQINKPNLHFNTVLYTGNGTSQSITGVNFQPDATWIKSRSGTTGHTLWDAVRGVTKWVTPHGNNIEQTYAGGLTSFNSDGFSIGDGSDINTNSATQVSWNWKANGSGSANSDGTYSSTVSANTASGFSIVTFVGTGSNGSVGHGLGKTPAFIMVKNLDNATNWTLYHKSLGVNKYIQLNTTNTAADASGYWGTVNSTSFGVTSGHTTLNNNYVAYCWAEIPGYSKFGRFRGATNAEFVYTGFKPAFVIQKRSTIASNWYMFDNKRSVDNVKKKYLDADTTDAEGTASQGMDFVSNGFLDRNFLADNDDELIYIAFAESPLVGTNNVCATGA